jgi:DNA helicase HerA-like ATPase
MHVVQLSGLSDDAKRVVVNAVIREISEGLNSANSHLRRVLVVADELNKFAPAGRPSPIKEQVIDIVARGRDLRFSLVGAQQFASEVDGQVYGNSATRVLGYSDVGELSNAIYRELGDFKESIPMLQKGQMLFRHPVYPAPLIMWFPSPMHAVRPQPVVQQAVGGAQPSQ